MQVYSKTITLPENKAVLTAFAIPESSATNPYNYEWSLISGPSMENAGSMENRQNQTLSLNDLQVGFYQLKVIVSGGSPPVHGVGFGNVTVSPRMYFLTIFWDGFHRNLICHRFLLNPNPTR